MFDIKPAGRMVRPPSTQISIFTYGGLHRATALCALRDVVMSSESCSIHEFLARRGLSAPSIQQPWRAIVDFPHQDALIDRSRAVVAKRFLEESDAEVLVMIDHDVEWNGGNPSIGYEGDLLHIARLAAEHQAIVGAAVSKRVKNQGWASMIYDDGQEPHHGDVTIGKPTIVRFHYVGAAFTAYPRQVLQAVADSMEEIPPGFRPIFLPCVVQHPMDPKLELHLYEDWALCHRATELGFNTYLATMPLTKHWGDYPYQILGDAIPESAIRHARPLDAVEDVYANRTKISLLHATRGRTEMARNAYRQWVSRATFPERLEYIFSYDEDDPSERPHEGLDLECYSMMAVEQNNAGNVDAYNYAAYHSSGDILVQVHDDVIPPEGWDVELDKRLDVDKEQVLHVNDGLPPEVNAKPWLIPILIGTRRWFEGCGFFFHPGYASIYCDDDASRMAMEHGVVVDAADLVFEHNWQGPERDETQLRSYGGARWDIGLAMFKSREESGFTRHPNMWEDLAPSVQPVEVDSD